MIKRKKIKKVTTLIITPMCVCGYSWGDGIIFIL